MAEEDVIQLEFRKYLLWGEMGYVYVEKGNNALQLESQCAWAVPDVYTEANYPCYEGGANCQ